MKGSSIRGTRGDALRDAVQRLSIDKSIVREQKGRKEQCFRWAAKIVDDYPASERLRVQAELQYIIDTADILPINKLALVIALDKRLAENHVLDKDILIVVEDDGVEVVTTEPTVFVNWEQDSSQSGRGLDVRDSDIIEVLDVGEPPAENARVFTFNDNQWLNLIYPKPSKK